MAEEDGEEEKRSDESEEEDKRMEEEEEGESQMSQSDFSNAPQRMPGSSMMFGADANNANAASSAANKGSNLEDDPRIDQVFYFMSQALLFGRMENWEKIKLNLLTCALCVISATRAMATGQQALARLRIMDSSDAGMEEGGRSRARSLSSASALDNLPEMLGRLRPFLIMLSLVDLIKTTWHGRVADDANQSI